MVEVHPRPDEALSDAEQQLDLDGFRDLMAAIVPIHEHARHLYDTTPIGGASVGGGTGLSRH
jgi:3-deoxy-D-manno-octulosonic acid (KDO) 8-phosphate synthase